MGVDKATLEFHGKPQVVWAHEMLAAVCECAFVSVRPDQVNDPIRMRLPQIVDLQPGIGPIAGISAALTQHPDSAWLVLACDLPFLSRTTLDHLIAQRDPKKFATAYRSAHDGLPEPLCAIWEPKSLVRVREWIALGKECPRKLLIHSDTALLDQPDARSLDNVNTPQERAAANAVLT